MNMHLTSTARWAHDYALDIGLLLLRLTTSALLFWTSGWPKLLHYADELQHIDDPLGLGRAMTLWLALLAEVVCPVAVAAGVFTRAAFIPIVVLLLVALLGVHPGWTWDQGQVGWLYLIVFTSLMLAGPGRLVVPWHR